MNDVANKQFYSIVNATLDFWNEFAAEHGYEPLASTNDKIRKVIRRRLRAEKDFLIRMPLYFKLIHEHCGGVDEFGERLNLRSFLRTTSLLRALRAHEQATGNSMLNALC